MEAEHVQERHGEQVAQTRKIVDQSQPAQKERQMSGLPLQAQTTEQDAELSTEVSSVDAGAED